jgi:uncharacterized protein with PQ loop repeat
MEATKVAETSDDNMRYIAHITGMVAALCFFVQYVPQMWLNYQRKHVKGFSKLGIVIKHVGASFLWVNSMILGETFSVISYGLFNVLQHSTFMLQFTLYGETPETKGNSNYLLWLMFPLVPAMLGMRYPNTITLTNSFKPIAQVLSHLPQLAECIKLKTTIGCSLMSQHINFVGGLLGLFMCYWIPPVAKTTYLIYLFSTLQAVSIYLLAFKYGELFNRTGPTKFKQDGDREPGNNGLDLKEIKVSM